MISKILLAGIAVLGLGVTGVAVQQGVFSGPAKTSELVVAKTIPVTIEGPGSRHRFDVERAVTKEEQAQGLMYRTDLTPTGGMLFFPYPAGGGAPVEASFWMKNTPTSLDILFIRADGTVARIADNTTPFAETPIPSGEPVAAVLELVGGRTAEMGIAEGDKVSWAGRK